MPDDRDIAALAGPERPTMSTRAVWAVLVAGLAGAVLLPESRVGLSLTLVPLVVAAAYAFARSGKLTRSELGFGVLALALSVLPTLRSAEWILAIDLLAAMGLACVAVTSAAAWRTMLVAPFVLLGSARWVPGNLTRPALDRVRDREAEGIRAFVRTAGITLALLVVFGTLFMSADAAFARWANEILLPDVRVDMTFARIFSFSIVALFTGALILTGPGAVTSTGEVGSGSAAVPDEGHRRSISEWALPIAALDVLFASFVAVQLTVLFGGRHHVELTPGLTYAEYARQGFFQLLAVAALVLAVVAVTLWVVQPRDARTKKVARVVLGALCGLTLVVLASAWFRLGVYEDAYGLTRLRVSVYGSIVWLAVIFSMLIAAGLLWKASWLPRSVIASTAVGLLVFTLINPDGLIATRNVERYEATGRIDLGYLATLSEDAVPALERLPDEMRSCVLAQLAFSRGTRDDFGWTEFNVARAGARNALDRLDVPSEPPAGCLYSLSRY